VNRTLKAGDACFVMPHYSRGPAEIDYAIRAIESVWNQVDMGWHLIVVDDCSPATESLDVITRMAMRSGGKMTVINSTTNLGPGECRNRAIMRAAEIGAPFVLFLDSDDIALPQRLTRIRDAFQDPEVDFAYSNFSVIDKDSNVLERGRITPSLLEILDACALCPPEGYGPSVLEEIGTRTGYATLTSTIGVRTRIGLENPFPNYRAGEDEYTWYQYFSASRKIKFIPDVLALYRVPGGKHGSRSRQQLGGDFYFKSVEAARVGFIRAIDSAIEQNIFGPERRMPLIKGFCQRIANTMRGENQLVLAEMLMRNAEGSLDSLDAV
jgi:hypothetical protein